MFSPSMYVVISSAEVVGCSIKEMATFTAAVNSAKALSDMVVAMGDNE